MSDQSEEVLRLIRERESHKRQEQLRANRRRHVRVSLSISIRFKLVEWLGQELRHVTGHGTGSTVDVSLSGASFTTDLHLPDGLVIQIDFTETPWTGVGPLRAHVVRTDTSGDVPVVSVEFTRIARADRDKLHALLLNRLRTLS